jgi:hypothetical protein
MHHHRAWLTDWALTGQGEEDWKHNGGGTSGTSGASQTPLQPGGFYTLQNIVRKHVQWFCTRITFRQLQNLKFKLGASTIVLYSK